MRQGDVLHGFAVRSVKEIPEQKATLYQLEYVKNGAELIWLDNGENNKLFSIAFKTLPSDDTGVFHILEHSVLCGSKKYPVKEPFVHMLKSSMSTFLNAMTFPDKTIYPVSSRNENDFMNLVEVYLDAVFYPAIYDSPFAFYQEGWHYELENADEDPVYKGVVYNEMKGAFSSVHMRVGQGMDRMLFPDSCYRFVSGGDPEKIPDLTYEDYVAAHREYYHPSNAKIYLDGDVPIERVLALLDEEYLSRFDSSGKDHEVVFQQPTAGGSAVEYYAIGDGEDADERAYMAFGKIACDYSDRSKLMALMVLSSYLTGSNEAPLKQAILREGLAQDAYLVVADGIAQPYCYLEICNTEYERRDGIKTAVRETVGRILAEGLDKDELDAIINQIEFEIRDIDEPQGLGRNILILGSWLYGGAPELYLENDALFQFLRDAVHTGYYEDLLREVLLDSEHMSKLYLLPSATKAEEDFRAECDRLAAQKAAWSKQELQGILELNGKLHEWQSQPDSKEALAALPSLLVDEIDPDIHLLETEHAMQWKIPLLIHKVEKTGIIHFNLYFSLADIPAERWSDISFMTNILGMLPTKRHSAYELQREIKRSIGFLDYNIVAYAVPGQPDCCKPYFTVNCSVLRDRLGEAVQLIVEILSETLYEGEQSIELIYDILMQCDDSVRQGILESGDSFAFKRAASYSSAQAMFMEHAEGYSIYRWLEGFVSDFEGRIEDFLAYARKVQDTVFSSARMTASITADELCDEFQVLAEKLEKPGSLPAPESMTIALGGDKMQEIIRIPTGISYSASANYLSRYGRKYSGSLRVLATIFTYDYLWNQVRVKGGAYGCGCNVGATGNIGFFSFRDPNPLASVDVYRKTEAFVRELCAGEESIDNYIISTAAATEPLQSLREQGLSADADAFSGISSADRARIRQEILHTTKDGLLTFCDLFKDMAEDNSLCIIGSADAVRECGKEWDILDF